jgi:hypothetical protein
MGVVPLNINCENLFLDLLAADAKVANRPILECAVPAPTTRYPYLFYFHVEKYVNIKCTGIFCVLVLYKFSTWSRSYPKITASEKVAAITALVSQPLNKISFHHNYSQTDSG